MRSMEKCIKQPINLNILLPFLPNANRKKIIKSVINAVKYRFVGMTVIFNQWGSFLINHGLFVFILINK